MLIVDLKKARMLLHEQRHSSRSVTNPILSTNQAPQSSF